VVKKGESSPVPGGCHATRAQAIKHQRALYANEPSARMASVSAMAAPLKPPRTWFDAEEPNGPQPLTVSGDGQVTGHLALWGSCHTGFLNGAHEECVTAPRTATDYSMFHLGQIETEDGSLMPVGKLTYATDHAPLSAGLQAASAHYDNTGSVAAFVRARDGIYGIWLAGALRSDLSPEGLRDLRANPLSGDWRMLRHNLELVAALAVPVPGFPVPHSQMAMAASGEVSTLILSTPTEDEMRPARSRAYQREKSLIASSLG
jgi:hypothetical protein